MGVRLALRLALLLAAAAARPAGASAQAPLPAPGPMPPQGPPPPPGSVPPPMPWRPIPSPVPEDENQSALAIRVKRAIPISGAPIDDATILVRDGKIAAIGKIVEVPKGVRRVDYRDLIAMPGLVDAFSRAALGPGPRNRALGGAPGAPKLRDAIDPDDEALRLARRAGITAAGVVADARGAGILPGAAVRTFGAAGEDLVLREEAFFVFDFESSTSGKDTIRQSLEKAREEIEKAEKAKEAPASKPVASAPATAPAATAPASAPAPAPRPAAPPRPDPKLEAWVKVLKKERKLVTVINSPSEWLHFQDATRTFEFDRVIVSVPSIAAAAESLGAAKATVLLPAEEIVYEPFTRNRINAAAELRRAGATVILLPHADSRDGFESWLFKAGTLVRIGLTETDALEAVTRRPAELLGLGEKIGTLAAGRSADILFLDGHPFDASTRIRQVMVAGELVPEARL